MESSVNEQLLAKINERLSSISEEALRDAEDGAEMGIQTSGVKQLLSYFEDKLAHDPRLQSYDRPDLYDIFEQSIKKSLVDTKYTERYEEFAGITIFHFIHDADAAEYAVSEIEDFLRMI